MQLDGVAFDEDRLERLDAHAMERGRPIEQHGVIANHLLQDVPDLGVLPLEHLLGALDRVGVAELLEPPDDERLVELERDLLRQAALVQPQRRPDHDHRAGGVVHPLAEQVLAEAALLPLDHVGEALERAVARREHRPLAAVVVEEGVDRLLEHPLLVADDDLGSVQVDELLEPVVAIDDPAVEVVQVARREVAAVEHHERPQVGRDHRDDVEHHPLRLVLAVADRLDDLQPVDEVLFLLLGVRGLEIDPQLLRERHEIEGEQELPDRLGAHLGLERAVAVGGAGLAILLLGEQLLLLQRRVLRIQNDVILEVDHLLQARRLHVEQRAQPARHRLEEPDVDDGRRQLDVPHPLPPHATVRDLHAAAVADHALVLHAAILAAGTLPVLLRSEDPLAHQPILLRAVGAVVDRLGLLHLPERPAADVVRPGEADLHG